MKIKFILASVFSCSSTMNNNLAILIGINLNNSLKFKFGANNSFVPKNINMILEMEYQYNNLLTSISCQPFKKNKLYSIHIKNIFTYFTLGIYHEISNYKKIEVGINKKTIENEQQYSPINLKFIVGVKLTQKNFNPYLGIEITISNQLSDKEKVFFEVKGESDCLYVTKKTPDSSTDSTSNEILNSSNLTTPDSPKEISTSNEILFTSESTTLPTNTQNDNIPQAETTSDKNIDIQSTSNKDLSDNQITDEDVKNFSDICSLLTSKKIWTLSDFRERQKKTDLSIIRSALSSNKIEDFEGYKKTALLERNDYNNLIQILEQQKQNNQLTIFNCLSFDNYDDTWTTLIKRYPIINDIVEYLVINQNKEIFIPILRNQHYISYYIYKNANNQLQTIKLDPISIQADASSCGFVVIYFAKLACENVLKYLCEHENLLQNIKEIAIQNCGYNIFTYLKEPEIIYLSQIYEDYKNFFNQDSLLNDIIANIKNEKFGSLVRKIILDYYLKFQNFNSTQ